MKSYYHFRSELNHIASGTTFRAWLERKRHYPGPTWADHVLSWHLRLKDFDPKDYLWLRYEAIIKDPRNTIKQLVRFLGLPQLSNAGVHRVMDMSSREAMQKLEAKHGAGFSQNVTANATNLLEWYTTARHGKTRTTKVHWNIL